MQERIRTRLKALWPELMEALDNPALHRALEIDGLEVNRGAIKAISEELGIHLCTSEDGRLRMSEAYSKAFTM